MFPRPGPSSLHFTKRLHVLCSLDVIMSNRRARGPPNVSNVEEIKLQEASRRSSDDNSIPERLDSLDHLFGLPRNQVDQWPGIRAYCNFLEHCFELILGEEFDSVWEGLKCSKPQNGTGCWPWFLSICLALKKLQQDDPSIEDVWNEIRISQSGGTIAASDYADHSHCKVAIFASLCWATMILQPTLLVKEFKGQPSLAVRYRGRNFQGLKMSFAARPIPVTFREFQHSLPSGRWLQLIAGNHENSTALYVSTLNYATLKTISKIRLAWVSDLSSHLEFDPTSRVLYVFRFPSFCALSVLQTNQNVILERSAQE